MNREAESAALSAQGRELLMRRLARPAPGLAGGTGGRQEGPSELSANQRRLWFLHQLSGAPAYNVLTSHRLRGTVDADALAEAVARVGRRHEVLRARFPAHEGEPRQVIDPADLELARTDLSAETDPVAAAHRLAENESATAFRLDVEPLARFRLAVLGPGDHVLIVVAHHILVDRESLEVICAEVSACYRGIVSGADLSLPPLVAQYADYARWQRERTEGPDFRRMLDYWRTALAEVPVVLDLPTDHERPAQPGHQAGEVRIAVPRAAADAVRAVAARLSSSLFMAGLAAFQALLSRYTGASEVIVGCPFNGRGRTAFEGLIGFFTNTLPIVARTADDPTGTELVQRSREAMLSAHGHQDVPFDRIVAEIGPPRDLARSPLVQVWFDLAAGPRRVGDLLDLPGVRSEFFTEGPVRTRFDLELHLCEEHDGTIGGRLLYARDLFTEDTAAALAEYYVAFLTTLGADPDRRLSAVRFLSADQERVLVQQWSTGG